MSFGKEKSAIFSIIVYALLVIFTYFFRLGGDNYEFIVDLLAIINPLIAIYFGSSALKYFGRDTIQGKSILFLIATIVLWWLGDLMWWVFASNAVVSAADIFWLFAYPSFLISVYYGSKVIIPDFDYSAHKKWIISYLGAFIIISLAYFKFFPMSWEDHMGILENLVTTGYVVADFLLIISVMFMINLIFLIRKGTYKTTWILIGVATLLFLWGDLYYAVYHETYAGGDLIDASWAMSYLVYALSFLVLKNNAEKVILAAEDSINKQVKNFKKKAKKKK